MLIQSEAIQADQSAPLVAAEVRAAEARQGTDLPQFDGRAIVLAEAGPTAADAAKKTTADTTTKKAVALPANPEKAAAAVNQTADARVVAILHGVNQSEISAGKLAEKNGQSKGVKDFGAMLVHDHQAADKKILSYAHGHGINPNLMPAVNREDAARERSDLARLAMLSGPAFDRGFANNMMDGHKWAIDTVKKSRAAVTDPKLNGLLGELQPMLQKHEQIAQKLASGQPVASMKAPKSTEAQGRRPTSH